MQDVFVRTKTKDYDTWYRVFSDQTPPTREEYGIHSAGVYRETSDPNAVILHFEVEDVGRMQEYLALPEFESFSNEAGVVDRTFWFGNLPAA